MSTEEKLMELAKRRTVESYLFSVVGLIEYKLKLNLTNDTKASLLAAQQGAKMLALFCHDKGI